MFRKTPAYNFKYGGRRKGAFVPEICRSRNIFRAVRTKSSPSFCFSLSRLHAATEVRRRFASNVFCISLSQGRATKWGPDILYDTREIYREPRLTDHNLQSVSNRSKIDGIRLRLKINLVQVRYNHGHRPPLYPSFTVIKSVC